MDPQLAVRQSSMELVSSLQDLASWQKEIKAKEKALQSGQLTLTKAPPRHTLPSEPILAEGASKATRVVKLPDTHEADRLRFHQRKEEGNQHFQAHCYDAALSAYNACLVLVPEDSTALCNRAAVFLKLSRFSEAEKDCSQVIESDAKNVKALFRRATARKELKNVGGSRKDVEDVLKIEPQNKAARILLAQLQGNNSDNSMVDASKHDGVTAIINPKSQTIAQPVPVDSTNLGFSGRDDRKSSSSAVRSDVSQPHTRRKIVVEEVDDEEESTKPLVSIKPLTLSGKKTSTTSSSSIVNIQPASCGPTSTLFDIKSASLSSSGLSDSSAVKPERSRCIRSALEFQTAYRGVRHDPEQVHVLLSEIDSNNLVAFMQTTIDSSMLSTLLTAIGHATQTTRQASVNWQVLKALPRLSRFSLLSTFLSKAEKEMIRSSLGLIDQQKNELCVQELELEDLRRTYHL